MKLPHLLLLLISLLLSFLCLILAEPSRYTWRPQTKLTKIRKLQTAIDNDNCHIKPKSQLRLPHGVVAQIPLFNTIPTTQFFPNRSGLLHLHAMAMNRAFFFSYALQYFNQSKQDFQDLPGLLYHYLSVGADVTSSRLINGSTLMYSPDMFYPNWYTPLPFNRTVDLFAVRAIRGDDTFDGDNWLREPTLTTVQVYDMAASDDNYTQPSFRNAPWYGLDTNDPGFLPDNKPSTDVGIRKQIYQFAIHWTPTDKTTHNFFGPPFPGELETKYMPVRFTQPWFDCGHPHRALNDWLLSSVSPVVDFMPRYGKVPLLQKPTYVALTAMDTFLTKIPVNLCPYSVGNPEVNLLENSDLCHRESTICEAAYRPEQTSQLLPLSFRCRCKPGYSDVFYQHAPFKGYIISRSATEREYESDAYRCFPIRNRYQWPKVDGITDRGMPSERVRLDRRRRSVNESREDTVDKEQLEKMWRLEAEEADREAVEELDRKLKAVGNVPDPDRPRAAKKRPSYVPKFDANWLPKPHKVTKRAVPRFDGKTAAKPPKAIPLAAEEGTGGGETVTNTTAQPTPELFTEATTKAPEPSKKPRTKINILEEESFKFLNLTAFHRARKMVEFVDSMTPEGCKQIDGRRLWLPGTVSYGAETQFFDQASTALRLAHLLSAFLQNVPGRDDVIAGLRVGQRLHEQTVFGEVLGNIAGDNLIYSSGVLFAKDHFVDSTGTLRKHFGPTAYRMMSKASQSFTARDLAGWGGYHDLPWFRTLKERFAFNTFGLKRFRVKAWIRPNSVSKRLLRYSRYPMHFYAPRIEDGYWSRAYYDCRGPMPQWLITFAVPFFTRAKVGEQILFGGVVTVTVKLSKLNINQCAGTFHTPNYFKNSNLCDQRTTYCKQSWGNGFSMGNYECHCNHDFAFPFFGERYFFIGSSMDTQFLQKLKHKPNIFDIMKCRRDAAGELLPLSAWKLIVAAAVVIFTSKWSF